MTATNHALTGAVIAIAIQQPLVAISFAFISHYLTDFIPHFSFPTKDIFKRKFNTLLIADALVCILLVGLVYLMFPANWLLIAVCMFIATSPDFAWAYYRLYLEKLKGKKPKLDPLNQWHHDIQASSDSRFARRGLRNELLWFSMTSILILGAWYYAL
jgi:hypothetical protein